MLFCNICQNMMFINNSVDKLEYVCKNCNFVKEEENTLESKCLSVNYYKSDNDSKLKIDSSIKNDPTLPRIDFVKCPNEECEDKENKVIYIKTNQKDLKFTYFCCNCDHFWNSK